MTTTFCLELFYTLILFMAYQIVCDILQTSNDQKIVQTRTKIQMLYRLFYISRLIKKNIFDEENIANQIVSNAILNNTKIGITGAMTFDGNDFAQILEGEKSVVLELYEKIKADPRHNNITLIKEQDIKTRHYQKWAMKHLDSSNYDELVRVMN